MGRELPLRAFLANVVECTLSGRKANGTAAPPAGGLFDDDARDQLGLFDKPLAPGRSSRPLPPADTFATLGIRGCQRHIQNRESPFALPRPGAPLWRLSNASPPWIFFLERATCIDNPEQAKTVPCRPIENAPAISAMRVF